MSRTKISGAIATVSALALLAACTPSSSDPSDTRDDATSAEVSPAPEFRIGTVADDAGEADDSAEASASPTATDGPVGETAPTGGDIDVDAGKRLVLSVDGAVLKDVSLVDPDHPKIAVDPGTFVDAAGAELETDDQPTAGGLTSTEEDTDAPSPAATSAPESSESPTADSGGDAENTVTAPDSAAGWTSDFDLVADSTYEVSATATTPDGKDHDFEATATVAASDAEPMTMRTVLSDDQTVGVAAPIILTFGSTVAKEYRDDVEHRLSVDVTDEDGKKREVEGSWAWLPNDPESRLHFRPKEYWPAYSKVSVDAPVKNVPMADGRVGANDLTLDVEIGREQVTEASAKTHRMTVTRDGKEVMDFPTSLGSAKAPSYNGTHVVMSKHANYTMTSARWGYTTPVQWAVRIHNNGEFVHAAPWSAGVQGSQNVSHGCINLTTQRAKEYYDSAIYGDPVIIKDSSVDLSTEDSDISDWVYSWDEWKKLSALN
ncbi:Ig-like domain-containing protein [Brevibacterium sp. 2SA]|uniref:Ig-like domain-containing protein n=1 Tax=Brevibacterium sp. 2SA TaxID=2502198 RepID=UPI0010FA54BC|nr:Ig-like domain-containing protein [Brevibacterium sp. 2SA]